MKKIVKILSLITLLGLFITFHYQMPVGFTSFMVMEFFIFLFAINKFYIDIKKEMNKSDEEETDKIIKEKLNKINVKLNRKERKELIKTLLEKLS